MNFKNIAEKCTLLPLAQYFVYRNSDIGWMSSLLSACYISYALPWYILSVIPCFRPQIRQFIHMQHRNNTCNWTRPWEPLGYRIENENNPSTQIYRIASVHYHFNLLDRLAISHRVGHLCAKMKTIWQLKWHGCYGEAKLHDLWV